MPASLRCRLSLKFDFQCLAWQELRTDVDHRGQTCMICFT